MQRQSLLDQSNKDSCISKSPFRGILRIALLVGAIYAARSFLLGQRARGSAAWATNKQAYSLIPGEVKKVIFYWFFMAVYTQLSLLIQIMVFHGWIESWLFDFAVE